MKNKLCIFFLFFYCCAFAQKIPDLYLIGMDIAADSTKNKLNLDNTIFKSNRIFYYDYHVQEGKNTAVSFKYMMEPYFKIGQKDTILEFKINKIVQHTHDSLSKGYPVTHFSLEVMPGILNMPSLAKEQTIIAYKCYNKDREIKSFLETTGVVEDPTQIFLHPPRPVCFKPLQMSPFPYLTKPLFIGKKWTSNKYMNASTARRAGWDTTKDVVLKCEYIVKDKIMMDLAMGKLEVYHIEAKSTDEQGNIAYFCDMFFNQQYGFVHFLYQKWDNELLSITLKEVKDE
jgi:hypothetical protein